MRLEIRVTVPQTLDKIQQRLSRPRQLLERVRERLRSTWQDHWEQIERLPFRSRPAQPRVGGFAVRTGRLRRELLEGIRITNESVTGGTGLFYAGYVDALLRRRGIPEGLLAEPDWNAVAQELGDELVADD